MRNYWTTTLNMTLIVLAIGLGSFCAGLSYERFLEEFHRKNRRLLTQVKKEVTATQAQIFQLLHLTESRILTSINQNKRERIPSILSLRAETLMNCRLPAVHALAFVPSLKRSQSQARPSCLLKAPNQSRTLHLGEAQFEISKLLHDPCQNFLGVLSCRFSLLPLFYQYGLEKEIRIRHFGKCQPLFSCASFTIPGCSSTFVLHRSTPSLWQYLLSCKSQVFLLILFCGILMMISVYRGLFWSQKILLTLRSANRKLQAQMAHLHAEKQSQESACERLSNRIHFQAEARHQERELFGALHERYRRMAGQAQTINLLGAQLLLQESPSSKIFQEIHSIFQESTVILRRLTADQWHWEKRQSTSQSVLRAFKGSFCQK